MTKWLVVKESKCDGWRVVAEEYGIRSCFRRVNDFKEAYKLAKVMGFGKEPKIEE